MDIAYNSITKNYVAKHFNVELGLMSRICPYPKKPTMAWQPGNKIFKNHYEIIQELGKGRFGITYLVKDDKENRFVVKTLSDFLIQKFEQQSAELDRLQTKLSEEAVKLGRCQHPNIVKVKELFKEGSQICIVMEYVPGTDLSNLPQTPLRETIALKYIRQVGSALAHLHEHGLVHRDVKPANIILCAGESKVVLIDFGLAKGFDHPQTTLQTTTPNTADGFAPIELYNHNDKLGPYTDVYSLAATLYVLLTKQIPPKATDRSSQPQKFHLISPQEFNPKISDQLNNAIVKGLTLSPQKRPQTIKEWLDLLPKPNIFTFPQLEPMLFWAIVGALAAILGTIAAWIGIIKPNYPSNPTPMISPTDNKETPSPQNLNQ